MTSEHAREVEAALEVKLAQIGDSLGAVLTFVSPGASEVHAGASPAAAALSTSPREFEDYAVTPKTRRRRDKRHRQFVGLSLHRRVWFADASHRTLIIWASRNREALASRSAMNSRYRFVALITAICTGQAMNCDGGDSSVSSQRASPTNYGPPAIPPRVPQTRRGLPRHLPPLQRQAINLSPACAPWERMPMTKRTQIQLGCHDVI
jgi:hypothetical protein